MPPRQVVRVLHAALLVGLAAGGAVLAVVRTVATPPLAAGAPIGIALGAMTVMLLFAGASVFRSRVPRRRFDEAPDAYWDDPRTRGAAIVLWATTEGAGLMSAVAYYLTGQGVPALAFAAAVLTLLAYRPGRLEGEGAA